jgi:hypothetical protein
MPLTGEMSIRRRPRQPDFVGPARLTLLVADHRVVGRRLRAASLHRIYEGNGRVALVVFGVVEAVAFLFYMAVGRALWFFHDEWDFLAARRVGDLGDLFRAHNGHWFTLPVLAYRFLWWLFGLRTYLPYQALIIVLHLAIAALLRVVMRRAGVGPWIATVSASVFALFGVGWEDIIWPATIGWSGSLVFGLASLLLADHDGPPDRRDVLALVAALASLMCSAIGVTMVAVVGVAVLIRRGWRIAAALTLPCTVVYVFWWYGFARGTYRSTPYSLSELVRFVLGTAVNTFSAIGQVPVAGVALAVLLTVGLLAAWLPLTPENRARAAGPFALVVGASVFLILTGVGRATGVGATERSRYLHVVAALVLPAVAVAAGGVIRRWRALAPFVFALLLIGIPGNVQAIADAVDDQRDTARLYRRAVLAIPRVPEVTRLPRELRPLPSEQSGGYVSLGWLLDGVRSHRIPELHRVTNLEAAMARLRLSIAPTSFFPVPPTSPTCTRLDRPVMLHLDKSDSIEYRDGVIELVPAAQLPGRAYPMTFEPPRRKVSAPLWLLVLDGPVSLRVLSPSHSDRGTASICAPSRAFVTSSESHTSRISSP